MIAYKNHPDYRWCYVSNERGPTKGYLVGILPTGTHEVVCPPGGHGVAYGKQTAEALGLQAVEVDGFNIDGDMVFHGKPLIKRIDQLDYSGIFHKKGDFNHKPKDSGRCGDRELRVAARILAFLEDRRTRMMQYSDEELTKHIAEIVYAT